MKKWAWKLAVLCLFLFGTCAGWALAEETYAETSIADADEAQRTNIALAAQALDGKRLAAGEEFSFNESVGARTEERGFQSALNGRGVEVTGGGVAQAATTLYLALMQRDDIEYSSIHTYNESFTGNYVSSGYDAIVVDYDRDVDFSFTSYSEDELTIYMWIDGDTLCCYLAAEYNVEYETEEDTENAYIEKAYYDDDYGEELNHSERETNVVQAEEQIFGSEERWKNALMAAECVNDYMLTQGEVFSFAETVGEVCEEAGYFEAENASGEIVMGGGVEQAASAIFHAACDMKEIEMLSEQGDETLSFIYWGEGVLTIRLWGYEETLICEMISE